MMREIIVPGQKVRLCGISFQTLTKCVHEEKTVMETNKWKTFLDIVEIGSMRQAAERLGYTQPALTVMMNGLESEMGFPLLLRDRKGTRMTQEAKKLAPYIRAVLEAEKMFLEYAKTIEPRKILRIGCPQSIMVSVLPVFLQEFRQKYPDLVVEIETTSDSMRQHLEEGRLDFLLSDSCCTDGLEWIPLFEDTIYAAVSLESPLAEKNFVTIDELLEYPFLLPSLNPNGLTRRILRGREIPHHIDISTNDANTIFMLVGSGLGSALISGLLAPQCPKGVRLLSTSPSYRRTIGFAAKSFDTMNPVGKEFVQKVEAAYSTQEQ